MQSWVQVFPEGKLFGFFIDSGAGGVDGPFLVPDIKREVLLREVMHDTG